MKKLTVALLSLLLIFSLAACETQPEAEIRFVPLEATHEMAPDYVLKYVYHYDENWTQTGMTTYMNGELSQKTSYELDPESKQILKMTATAPDGATAEIEYRHTYDENGNVILTQQYAEGILATTTEYTYDPDGNRLSQTQKNPSNGTTSTITFDSDGNILRSETVSEARGVRPASHSWVEYTYDGSGNQIKAENYYNNGDGCVTTITEYDSQGRKVKSTATDSFRGTPNLDETREYTWEGNTETEKVYSGDGTLQLTGTKTYDEYGNLLVSESVSALTGSVSRSTTTWQKIEVPGK